MWFNGCTAFKFPALRLNFSLGSPLKKADGLVFNVTESYRKLNGNWKPQNLKSEYLFAVIKTCSCDNNAEEQQGRGPERRGPSKQIASVQHINTCIELETVELKSDIVLRTNGGRICCTTVKPEYNVDPCLQSPSMEAAM